MPLLCGAALVFAALAGCTAAVDPAPVGAIAPTPKPTGSPPPRVAWRRPAELPPPRRIAERLHPLFLCDIGDSFGDHATVTVEPAPCPVDLRATLPP